jgi:LacI family transcriptional regulator
MLVTDARGDPERERALAEQLGQQWVDGLIVSPLDPSAPLWAQIAATLPVVTVGDALPGPTVGEVLFDNRAGVGLVLERLHALGHRRVAVLTPSRPTTPDRPAELVVAEISEALALEAVVLNSPHSVDGATEVACRLLADKPRPTAVFCLSDSIACGVYAAAADCGLRIPRDLSVAGYDDHPIARALAPSLTTVSWGTAGVASAAARLLATAIAGRPRSRHRVRVSPELVERASTAAPRAAKAAV